MSYKKKINWLLILQAWAMLWVVIGHAFLGKHNEGPEWETMLGNFAYSFHMPLFMLVSGWLFFLTRLNANGLGGGGKFWLYGEIVKDKTIRLLLPGFVFSLVALSLKVAFPGEMSRQAGLSVSEIVNSYIYPYDNPFRELWFIITLFVFFLLTPMWRFILKRQCTIWLALVCLILLHFIHPTTTLLCIDRVCSHAIWFYLGLLISKQEYVDKFMVKQPWITFIVGVGLYFLGLYTDRFIVTMGGIAFSFGLALIADKYIPKLLCGFRNYTYQIFLMGIFAQMFIKILYKHIPMPYILAYVICIAVGLYVPVLISKLIEKINWKPLSLCVGLKTK